MARTSECNVRKPDCTHGQFLQTSLGFENTLYYIARSTPIKGPANGAKQDCRLQQML